ncbi:MAG: hypothetical protein AAGH53_01670 [Pseudomonadota bacterium]
MSGADKELRAEYCAAVLIQIASENKESAALQHPLDELGEKLRLRYRIAPTKKEVERAVEILENLEFAEVIDVGHARPHIFLPSGNFHGKGKNVFRDASLSLKLEDDYPILVAYKKLGETWLSEAVTEAFKEDYREEERLRSEEQLRFLKAMTTGYPDKAPAADRTVTVDHNSKQIQEIDEKLLELENVLEQSNEAGSIFGDHREVAKDEVGTLRRLMESARLRVSFFLDLSKRTLGWIAEKAGAAVVGDLAKSALKLIMNWLS